MAEVNNEQIIKVPKKYEEVAEIFGIMLGDGNLYMGKKYKVYQIRIAGSLIDEKEYLIGWIKPLIEKTFGVKTYIKIDNKTSEMFICVNSKRLALLLERYGFPAGNKKNNSVSIPNWIMKKPRLLKRCIRGLIDTDGFVYPKTKKHKHPCIWFVSGIKSLRDSFDLAMKKLELHPAKWTVKKSGWCEKSDVKQCCIARREDVIKYYKEIGFKNPKYIYRYNKFMLR